MENNKPTTYHVNDESDDEEDDYFSKRGRLDADVIKNFIYMDYIAEGKTFQTILPYLNFDTNSKRLRRRRGL